MQSRLRSWASLLPTSRCSAAVVARATTSTAHAPRWPVAGPSRTAALLGLGRSSTEHRRRVVVSRYDTRHVDVYRSARRHGVADADILHAVDHALGAAEQDDGKVLYLGADRAGNMLEVIAIERDDGTEIVIHAMRMRRLYEPLLREMRGTND